MINTFAHSFPNMGYVSARLTDSELLPIRTEVNNIRGARHTAQHLDISNAGSVVETYEMTETRDHMLPLLAVLVQRYSDQFNTALPDLVLEKLWVNFQRAGEYFAPHTHRGEYSFALWLENPFTVSMEDRVSPNGVRGTANARTPSFNFHYTNTIGQIKQHEIMCDKSQERNIILFPSQMNHSVYPFYSTDQERVVVSGNLVLKELAAG